MSGLSRTPGKRVWDNIPPRVRIPPSPPELLCNRLIIQAVIFFLAIFPYLYPYFGQRGGNFRIDVRIRKFRDGSEPASVATGQQPAFASQIDNTSGQSTPNARGQNGSTLTPTGC